MHLATQVELVRRFRRLKDDGTTDLAPAPYRCPASDYTSATMLAEERSRLFRQRPVLVALSADVPEPGSFLATEADGLPILVARADDGRARVFLNVCRHRASRVAEGRGTAARQLTCPYHAWSYGLDGELRRRPLAEDCYQGIDPTTLGLAELPSGEAQGLVLARLDGQGAVDAEAWLGGLADDLAGLGLAGYRHIETRTQRRPINWKMVIDTFLEAYHIFALHKTTIARDYYAQPMLFDRFDAHFRLIGVRRSIDGLGDDESTWSLLPHATVHHAVLPNALVVHQIDHVEVWLVYPDGDDPGSSVITTSLYAPSAPSTEKELRYWVKNLDALLGVTNNEDFPQCETIQQTLERGGATELLFGQNEPALIHFHATLRSMLGLDPLTSEVAPQRA